MRFLRLACFFGALLSALSACSADEQTDYSARNRDEFFTACTAPLTDSTLTTRICGCVFEAAQRDVAYERFVEIENAIIADPESRLAPEIAQLVADCVVEEADL